MKKKVFTNGVFDLFHEGHFNLLRKAKQEGDYLLVGVASDESCTRSKRQPLQSWNERAENVRKVPFVDEVISTAWSADLSKEFYLQNDIQVQVQGDKGSNFALAESMGILKIVGRTKGISTTKLLGIIQSHEAKILEGGDLNDVRRVFFEGAYYVLKSSHRTVARKYPIVLPDHRTRDEYDVIQAFRECTPSPDFIVNPIYSDRESITVFESAPAQAESLLSRLLNGVVSDSLILDIVRHLALLHKSTRANADLRRRFACNDGYLKIKIDIQCRQATRDQDLADRINRFLERSLAIQSVLLHGDFAPKNILVWDPDAFLFIDFEESGYGDPALDVGYFLAHLLIHGVIAGGSEENSLLAHALDSYIGDFGVADSEFVARVNVYVGIFLLSRLESKAPASYIPPQFFEQVRKIGSRLVKGDGMIV